MKRKASAVLSEEVLRLYQIPTNSARKIAKILDTNHKLIVRILERNNIQVIRKKGTYTYTEEHRLKISKTSKGRLGARRGVKSSDNECKKNMIGKLKRNEITFQYLEKFTDYGKLKFLTSILARHKKHFITDDSFKGFLEKFYFDNQFNSLYAMWKNKDENKWYRPSLDHKIPKSKGGDFSLENLQFLSWFENWAKCNRTCEEWEIFKKETNTTSNLFF